MAHESSAPPPAAGSPPPARGREQTPTGRYIPYSGGSAGWFENSGVLKSERRNNYRFHQEMDLPEVRAQQFLRWGPSFDRRSGLPRARRQVPIHLLREGETLTATTWDINNRGLRLQFSEPVQMAVGDEYGVEVLDAGGSQVIARVDTQVIWIDRSGTTRPVWNVGLFFPHITPEVAAELDRLLRA